MGYCPVHGLEIAGIWFPGVRKFGMSDASELRKRDTEQRILASAAALFARFGYNGVGTRDIASVAEVNEVTIYRHYPRKRDLYLAVISSQLKHVQLQEDLLVRIADARDGQAALESAWALIAATVSQKPELIRLLQYSTLELKEDLNPLLRENVGELVDVVVRHLNPWIDKGDLRGTSGKALVLTLIAIAVHHRCLNHLFSGNGSGVFDAKSVFEF
jgi:AcrR family transcriptional regulator